MDFCQHYFVYGLTVHVVQILVISFWIPKSSRAAPWYAWLKCGYALKREVKGRATLELQWL